MIVQALNIDRDKARELWRKYQEHRNHQEPYDADIAAIYKRIAQGRTVIRALEAIRSAGLDAQGLPKLAIAPAHMTECYWRRSREACTFGERWPRRNARRTVVRMVWPGLSAGGREGFAIVPLVPVHLRPRRGLANYHILWEAEWTRAYPRDPYLLRRFGGDAWLVVAAWELTDVERAVMSQRLNG